MDTTKNIEKEEYIKVKLKALEDAKKFAFFNKSADERYQEAVNKAKEINFKNNDLRQIYISNLLIPNDEEFKKVYGECGKQANKCADKYNVPMSVIFAKVFEINIYSSYLEGVDLMVPSSEFENDSFLEEMLEYKMDAKEEDNVTKATEDAVSKINKLFDSYDSMTQTISSQTTTIDRQVEALNRMREELKEKEKTIEFYKAEVLDLKETIDKMKKEGDELIAFYRKVMSSLNRTPQNMDEQRKKIN